MKLTGATVLEGVIDALRDQVSPARRRVLQRRQMSLTVVRAAIENRAEGYDKALWQRIGEQGWCGAAIPEAFGGIGFTRGPIATSSTAVPGTLACCLMPKRAAGISGKRQSVT